MTLGPQPVDVRRIAGMAGAWGQVVNVKTGDPCPRTELVRASVGYPMVWSWTVFFDGNAAGGLVKPVPVWVQPGLGRGGVNKGQAFALQPGPGIGPTFAGGVGTAATELVILVETDELALSDYTICAVASPVFWCPWIVGPQG